MVRLMQKIAAGAFIAIACTGAGFADELSLEQTADVRAALKKIVPDSASAQITKTPIDGLYQVQLGMTIVYMSADGHYFLNGGLIDLETRVDLGDKALNKARVNAMQNIPESSMIIYPAKGEQKHFITVFSDIDCPYCAKLHKEIAGLNDAGITVRYLAYPRAGMGSTSYFKAVSVWCADEPADAMNRAMQGVKPSKKTCVNPVREHMFQAKVFEVNGTPNIILDNGQLIPGYVPAKELIKILAQ